jgi:hypothetical protein
MWRIHSNPGTHGEVNTCTSVVKEKGSVFHHCDLIPSFTQIVGHDSSRKRRTQAQKLKADISSNKNIHMKVFLPDPESHKNHVKGQVKIGLILS